MISYIAIFLAHSSGQSTGISPSADARLIGKVRPGTYAALREYRMLPLIGDLTPAKRQSFTGTIITLDVPSRGDVHVMNYVNGKRVVLDNPKATVKQNGVPLTKMLTTLPPNADVRYTGPGGASFEVKLPGEEKKLNGFSGTLTQFSTSPGGKGLTITMVNGKAKSSAWLKSKPVHR